MGAVWGLGVLIKLSFLYWRFGVQGVIRSLLD